VFSSFLRFLLEPSRAIVFMISKKITYADDCRMESDASISVTGSRQIRKVNQKDQGFSNADVPGLFLFVMKLKIISVCVDSALECLQ
jgi:hypothetical protein